MNQNGVGLRLPKPALPLPLHLFPIPSPQPPPLPPPSRWFGGGSYICPRASELSRSPGFPHEHWPSVLASVQEDLINGPHRPWIEGVNTVAPNRFPLPGAGLLWKLNTRGQHELQNCRGAPEHLQARPGVALSAFLENSSLLVCVPAPC